MLILGISAFYHDSAAALIKNGEILFAAQEERFSRIKHDSNFPFQAIKKCIDFCSLDLNKIDYFCFYEKPFLKFERLLETYLAFAPKGFKSFANKKNIVSINLSRIQQIIDKQKAILNNKINLSNLQKKYKNLYCCWWWKYF